jgi:sulfur carrier protein
VTVDASADTTLNGAGDMDATVSTAVNVTVNGADDADATVSTAVSVTVNGVRRTVPPGTTVAALVAELGRGSRGVAVAVDREVVPRSLWEEVVVTEGANVEVVSAVAGG